MLNNFSYPPEIARSLKIPEKKAVIFKAGTGLLKIIQQISSSNRGNTLFPEWVEKFY